MRLHCGMVESTHDVTIGRCEVAKRYRSWSRGEPDREWAGLALLHRTCPGLAPQPLNRYEAAGVPVIVMSRLPGEPLGAAPLSGAQVTAVAGALRQLHSALPPAELANVPERRTGSAELHRELLAWIRQPHPPVSATVRSALEAASDWLSSAEAVTLVSSPRERVFTQGDGNLANFIWDGQRCRIVDFEDSGVSEPAYEVADLVEHVSVWLPGLIDVHALLNQLDFAPGQRQRLGGCRVLMAAYWLLMLLPGNPAHSRNPDGSVERQAQRVLDLLH